MYQLPRHALRWHKIKPPPRAHPRRQLQDAQCDRIAAAKIIEKPAVQVRGLQILLHCLYVKTHRAAHPIRQSTRLPTAYSFVSSYASRVTSASTCCSVTPRTSTRLLRL